MTLLLNPNRPRFNAEEHIRNTGTGEWMPCRNADGMSLPGIRGRPGAGSWLECGAEFGSDVIEMDAGSFFPLHVHEGAHILYVIRGRGIVRIDASVHPVRRGDTIFIPAEYPHAVSIPIGRGRLVFLAVGIPHKAIDALDRMKVVEEWESGA